MANTDPHVLIAGGGPSGLLASILLNNIGISSTVVERAKEPDEWCSKSYTLVKNSVDTLNLLHNIKLDPMLAITSSLPWHHQLLHREVIKQFHITWSVSLSQGGPLKLKHKFDKHGNQLLCVYLWDAGIDAGTYTDTDIFPITDKSDDTDYRSTTKTYELRTIPGDDLAYACLLSSLDNSTIPCRRFMTRLKSVFVGTVIFSQEDRNYQTLHALDGFKKNAKIVSVEHDSAQLALARLAEQDPQAKQALDNTLDVQVCVHVHKADSDGQPVEYLGEMKKLADMGNLITDFPKSAGTRGKVNNMLKTIGLGIGSSQSHGGAICWDTAGQVRDAILQKRRVIFDADAENCRKLSGKFLLSGVQLCGVEDGEPWAEI